MVYSVGKAIREINSKKINHSYFLSGNDCFLQDFFIKNLFNKFSDNTQIRYLNLEEDNDQRIILDELSSLSLFSKKTIYILRNFKKLSLKDKSFVIKYFDNPSLDNIIIFINDDFYSKNKFLDSISKKSIKIDVRTPFQNKIREWVQFYIKINHLNFDNQIIDEIINSYHDDISNIVNELEKISLFTNDTYVPYKELYELDSSNRNIRFWQLQDALGKKDVLLAINYLNELLLNGYSGIPIIINIFVFYKALMLKNIVADYSTNYNGLNKIINSKLQSYLYYYSYDELSNIFIAIKNIDELSKTTSLKHENIIFLFITKVCKNYYV